MPQKKARVIQLPQRRLATIMFTDLVGYTTLTQKNEAQALELLEEHRRLLRPLFDEHAGHEIKTMGDAFLVEFSSAQAAAHCAIAMQNAMMEHNISADPDKRLGIRIGMHLGDVEYRDGDVYGDGVNIASRIEPLAESGEIYISEDLARQIQNKIEAPVIRLGKRGLKNVELPMDIYRIVPPWEAHRTALSQRLLFFWKSRPLTPWLAFGLVLIALVAVLWLGQENPAVPTAPPPLPVAPEPMPEETALELHQVHAGLLSFLDSETYPASLRIIYEELHPTQEDSRILIQGTGEVQQEGDMLGGDIPRLRLAEMENLIRLLIDMEAWEQRIPWRETDSQKSRAYLRVQVGGVSSEIWEWYDELDKNGRIVKLLDQMKKFVLLDQPTTPTSPVNTQAKRIQSPPASSTTNLPVSSGKSESPPSALTVERATAALQVTETAARTSPAPRVPEATLSKDPVSPPVTVSVPSLPPLPDESTSPEIGQPTEPTPLPSMPEQPVSKEVSVPVETPSLPTSPEEITSQLMTGAGTGQIEIVQALLQAGADPNTRGKDQHTVLMEAARGGYTPVIQLLLDVGARVDDEDLRGRTALTEAAAGGHSEAVQILLDHQASVNAGKSSSFSRSLFGRVKTGFGLLGGDKDTDSQNGWSPLMMAASKDHSDTVRVLVKNGADLDVQDNQGRSALILAAAEGFLTTVEVLLEARPKIKQKDRQGRTALMWASRNGHSDVVEQIRRAGAK
ncbi:MAG: ankyrin repeat domain-containing protein [Acidobacteriota bacterium]